MKGYNPNNEIININFLFFETTLLYERYPIYFLNLLLNSLAPIEAESNTLLHNISIIKELQQNMYSFDESNDNNSIVLINLIDSSKHF